MLRGGSRLLAAAALAGLLLAAAPRSGLAAPVSTAEPDPTFVLTGKVVDADGNPTVIVTSYVIETFPDGSRATFSFEVAVDGSFSVALVRDGTPDSPVTVVVLAFGTPTDPVTDENGCELTYAPYGEAVINLPGTVPSEPVLVQLGAPRLLQGICPATAAPQLTTLPPTDTDATAPGNGAANASAGWAAVVGVLFVLIGASVVAMKTRQGRR